MAIKREIIFRQVLGNLGASAGVYTSPASQDEDYDDFAVMDAILNQEAFIFHTLAESWFNGNRSNESPLTDIIVARTVANGALIEKHMGPVIGVDLGGLPAVQCAANEVARLRVKNPLSLTLTDGLYGLIDNRLYFTGTGNATVYLFQFTRPTYTTIANFKNSDSPMPGEYQQAWVDLATAAVISREGDQLAAKQAFWRSGLGVTAEIQQENRPRPFVKDAQMAGI